MKLPRPSAPLIVSILALVIATSGTALAASHYLITSSRQIKPGAIALRNLSRGARSALRGASGPRGVQGISGMNGAPGVPGSARAYGYVQSGGLDPSLPNKDIASIAHPAAGIFCITLADGTTPRTSGILAIPDSDTDTTGTGPNESQAVIEIESVGCSPIAFKIRTFDRTETVSGGVVTAVNLNDADQGFFFMVP